MPTCIYCNEREVDSKEHSFPAGLGMDKIKGFSLLEGKLCKKCNSKISSIEEQFLRSSPEAFFRYMLGISGRKSHEKINPYHRPSAGGKPIKAKVHSTDDLPSGLCEPEGLSGNFTYSHQIVMKDSNGNFHRTIVPDNVNSSESLAELLRSKEMEEMLFHEAIIDHDRIHIIEELFSTEGKQFIWNDIPMGDHGKRDFAITFEFTDKYYRAIAKIAFHYMLQYFDHYSGKEKEFEGIKNFIMQGGEVKKWVTQLPGSFVEDFKSKAFTPNMHAHFIAATDTGDKIFVKLGFFYGPNCYRDRHFEVQIGKSPGLIKTPKDSAHQIIYFNEKDDQGYIGEMKELRKYSKRSPLVLPRRENMRELLKVIRGKI